jgi:hypothetical protein
MKNLIKTIALILGLSIGTMASAQERVKAGKTPKSAVHFKLKPHSPKKAAIVPSDAKANRVEKKAKSRAFNGRAMRHHQASVHPQHKKTIKMKKSRSAKGNAKAAESTEK